jgi:RepB DNA-primase from phage plasmid
VSQSAARPERARSAGAEPAALLIYRDGSVRCEAVAADEQVRLWAAVVHGGAGGLVEFVAATRRADGSLAMRARRDPANYPAAGDADALAALAAAASGRGEEAFCSVLARPVPEPGKKAVATGRVVWVDVDRVGSEAELGWLDVLRPHLWVASGGGIHCYWRLARELEAAEIESCNRRLARAVRGDPACTDRGRIMRLPGTLNRKRGRRCRIVRLELTRPPVDPDRLRSRLPDPEPPRPPRPTVRRLIAGGADELALTPPARVLPGARRRRCSGAGRLRPLPAARARGAHRLLPRVARPRAGLVVLRLQPWRRGLRPRVRAHGRADRRDAARVRLHGSPGAGPPIS